MKRKTLFAMLFAGLLSGSMQAQLSSNPYKFLGNITTGYKVDAGGGVPQYYKLWNQITCENESKWASVEGNRNSYNWNDADRAFNYAKQHNFTYKFHALVWGSQYPGWLSNLTPKNRFTAMTKWYDTAKAHYKTLPMIDVVNEAVENHQPGNPMMKETLGGGGKTGYDWLIKAFEMAYERWPNAILIYNDYNSIQWDIDKYITLVQTLRDAGAPIDAYGNQSHDVTDISANDLKNALKKQQDALLMPMFITELDIDKANDADQKAQFQRVLPLMWEAPYCAGVTLWGYVYGSTWVSASGLYKNGSERPAMTWIKEYMETEAAKKAVGPFPGTKKEASIYIRPASLRTAKGDVLPIKIRASLATKTIEKVDFYVNNELVKTMTEAPYIVEYTTTKVGWNNTKAVVTATDGSTYERYGRFSVLSSTTKRQPYFKDSIPQLPGTIRAAEYDLGASGVSYSKASRNVKTATVDGQWMEYTVDVMEDGVYSLDATVASAKSGGMFHLAEYTFDNLDFLTEYVDVPSTGATSNWKPMHVRLNTELKAGRHVFTLLVDKGGFCIDSLTFSRYDEDKYISCGVAAFKPTVIYAGDSVTVNINARSNTSTISKVNVYVDNLLVNTMTEEPYTFKYVPEESGLFSVTAIAFDAEGKEKLSAVRTMKVNAKRAPYKDVITIPGIIQAENFDKGGEGLAFHDSDAKDEGDANYRSDAGGVDLVKGNGGTALGYTAVDEWLEYSVNVTQGGEYKCVATVSSGATNSGFTLGLVKNGTVKTLCKVNVPQTGSDWNTYKRVTVEKLDIPLDYGEQILRITITGASCNIDKLELICTEPSGIHTVLRDAPNAPAYNLYGVPVNSSYRGIVIQNGKKILKK